MRKLWRVHPTWRKLRWTRSLFCACGPNICFQGYRSCNFRPFSENFLWLAQNIFLSKCGKLYGNWRSSDGYLITYIQHSRNGSEQVLKFYKMTFHFHHVGYNIKIIPHLFSNAHITFYIPLRVHFKQIFKGDPKMV